MAPKIENKWTILTQHDWTNITLIAIKTRTPFKQFKNNQTDRRIKTAFHLNILKERQKPSARFA